MANQAQLDPAERKRAAQSAAVRLARIWPLLGVVGLKAWRTLQSSFRPRRQVTTYFGAKFAVDLRQMLPERLFYFRCWEPNISTLIEEVLQPGDVFVDLGALVGYHALLASGLVGPAGRVVTVEASPHNFALLQQTIALNGADNVRAVHCAVAGEAGTVTLFAGSQGNTGASTIIARTDRAEVATIPARPLLDILTEDERARTRLIKIDIEGAELEVLKRLLETLDAWPRRTQIICEFDADVGGDTLRAVFAGFLEAGFEAWQVANPYSYGAHLAWRRPDPMTRVTALPPGQTDILLRRLDQD